MKHQAIIERIIKANHERDFFEFYPEHPNHYDQEYKTIAAQKFEALLNKPFHQLLQTGEKQWAGGEVSPFTLKPLGITYPLFQVDDLLHKSKVAQTLWKKTSISQRADILIDALENIKYRFFEIALATQHTTGQSAMMSFQASGPHACDRAIEAIAQGFESLTAYPENVVWNKKVGNSNISLSKTFTPVPKGVGLVIGCSTFPVWNTFPGLFANLISGNSVIVKPHPKAILPIAMAVLEVQKVLQLAGLDVNILQLACDTSEALLTKELCEHPEVNLIDYTGSSAFGEYVESLKHKTIFTEKAGVNSVIIDSAANLEDVFSNLAFSVTLYSGQMCTAPQNFLIPEKIIDGETEITFEEAVQKFKSAVNAIVTNKKIAANTIAAIQNESTLNRAMTIETLNCSLELASSPFENKEFPDARTCTPAIIVCNAKDKEVYERELFGPIFVLIKTKNTMQSIDIAKNMVKQFGAITCAAYTTNANLVELIKEEMGSVFAPVSFNLKGNIWMNQQAAFSDFHVTGANPSGNASFINAEFINRRFVWIGHRNMLS